MPDSINCPTIEEYESALLGSADPELVSQLESHLSVCHDCQQKLENHTSQGGLISAIQNRVPQVLSAFDPSLNEMVERLEDMASQFTPAGYDLSLHADHQTEPVASSYQPEDLRQMGGYRVVRLLGAGGMGLVYLAEDEVLRRQVAVKVLRPRLARKSRAREGFLREARAMASLKHDNVVTVFQVGEAAGPGGVTIPFLAMELLEGESLADWIRREGRLPVDWIPNIGRQAASGLAAAHACGVVHRDIKPGNLWLEAPSWWINLPKEDRPALPTVARIKILDFGLAQPSGEESADEKRVVLGTPAYMPPEQASGNEVDHRADLFSLGVVLYELTTGQRPFPREKPSDPPNYDAPKPVAELAPSVSPILADLIHRLLAPDPAERPKSARDVQQALIPLTNFGRDETIPMYVDRSQKRTAKSKRRTRWISVGCIFLAILVMSFVAKNYQRNPDQTVAELPNSGPPTELATYAGPPDEAWIQNVGQLPVDKQLASVLRKLQELNPAFDGQVNRISYQNGKVTEFAILTDEVTDIRPIRAFSELRLLQVVGSEPGKGKLVDLSPIAGLRLTTLNIWQNPNLVDVTPAKGMQLTLFQAGDTAITDLKPLEAMPIGTLAVNNCKVVDLSPIKSMPSLRFLRCDGCPLSSLNPILESTIRNIRFTRNPKRGDDEILKKKNDLEQINGISAKEFIKFNIGWR